MIRFLMGFAAIGSVAGAAAAADGGVKYRPFNVLFHGGYKDHAIAPDVWEVSGSESGMGAAQALALYRAAELADAANASEIRIVKQKLVTRTTTYRDSRAMEMSQSARLTFRAVRSDADRTACEMPKSENCLTVPVGALMAQYGPMLGMAARPIHSAAFAPPKPRFVPIQPVQQPLAAAMPVAAPPARALSPYEAGRAAAAAALAANGETTD